MIKYESQPNIKSINNYKPMSKKKIIVHPIYVTMTTMTHKMQWKGCESQLLLALECNQKLPIWVN